MRSSQDLRFPLDLARVVDKVRVFFALWPAATARDALAGLGHDVAARVQGRAPPDENLHMTLAFVGDISATRVAALRAIGMAVASTVPPFTLTLDQTGTFRGTGITWAGASAPPADLLQLVRRLVDALVADGFATEPRAFHPHVTLARRCRKPGSGAIAVPVAWTVARLALNASELSAAGPRYRELAGWPLGHIVLTSATS
jgi:2'-5' RNA ligase